MSKFQICLQCFYQIIKLGVSKNRVTPKSSILIGFSIINHPFWDTTIFGNTHLVSGFMCVFFVGSTVFPPNGIHVADQGGFS